MTRCFLKPDVSNQAKLSFAPNNLRWNNDVVAQRFCSLFFCLWLLTSHASADTYKNPIINDGADPWVIQKDGYYYYTHTTGFDIRIRKATQITGTNGLGNATPVTVFTPPSPNNQGVWAPELHFLNGKWYIYYAADNGSNPNHRMYVAEANTSNPQGSYTYKGKIHDPNADRWAIDGTVLQMDNGSLYFIWSGWPGGVDGQQNLYIAPMSNPWTISGSRVRIGQPNYSWEYPDGWGSSLQEGPQILKRNGKILIVYSANGSWTDEYRLGVMINTNGNVMDPDAWTKISTPVFTKYSDLNGSVYGPGHCSFAKSLDGKEDILFYHAAKYGGAGWNRNVRIQRFTWNADDTPNFDVPIPLNVPLTVPSGEGTAPTPETTYTLTVATGSGAVVKSPDQLSYKPGSLVTLTAQDYQGFRFTGWTADAWKTNRSITVLMDRDKAVTANYTLPLAVIDNTNATFTGTWTVSSISTNRFGTNYHYALTTNVGSSPFTARFTPNLSASGRYNIYFFYSSGPNRSTNAPWTISDLDGTSTVRVNQQLNGGVWLLLAGDRRFAQGTNGYVQLSNNTGESNNKVVIADAVIFAYSANQDVAPSIFAHPLSQTVEPGSEITLRVGAIGGTSYQWRFQNQDLAEATTATLTITNFNSAHEGEYHVRVGNGLGSITSSNALLRASSPLRLHSLQIDSSRHAHLQLVSARGSNYVLEASDNLRDWVSLETNLSINGFLDFTQASSSNSPQRFYRAVNR